MSNKIKLIIGAVAAVAVIIIVMQQGGDKGPAGRVSIVGNEFPAIHSVANKAQTYGDGAIEVKANLTADHQKINVDGMQGNPAEYTTAIIANSSLVALMNEDVVRPMNDLVAKHGGINDNQKITIDGDIMAIAFMANAQHLIYRADILEQVGAEVPTSYEEMLEVAEKVRSRWYFRISDFRCVSSRLEFGARIREYVYWAWC